MTSAVLLLTLVKGRDISITCVSEEASALALVELSA